MRRGLYPFGLLHSRGLPGITALGSPTASCVTSAGKPWRTLITVCGANPWQGPSQEFLGSTTNDATEIPAAVNWLAAARRDVAAGPPLRLHQPIGYLKNFIDNAG